MGFCIALLRGGILSAFIFFLTWSLPGAAGMYALAIGISHVSTTLPLPIYALLSGLNASVVGVIAFAAVQLATKAITDPLSRLIVVFSACAGLCYNALWYFPILMIGGGTSTVVWDIWIKGFVERLKIRWRRQNRDEVENVELPNAPPPPGGRVGRSREDDELSRRSVILLTSNIRPGEQPQNGRTAGADEDNATKEDASERSVPRPVNNVRRIIPAKVGLVVMALFLASFIAIMVANAQVKYPSLELRLFRNMYLAGTIIFGGGPVVIPLLREYVVQPGFVSPRDFLIGLAIIQAFPGPNFNFAVYLGTLTLAPTSTPSIAGAILAYLGIFAPGLFFAYGFQAMWRIIRSRPLVVSLIRGVNAAAVGLVFTAVYRLWEIGYLTPSRESGSSLGAEPWWVVTAVLTYTSAAWFGVETWMGIMGGAVLGLCWYGVVKPW